jgi:hypothetical protein
MKEVVINSVKTAVKKLQERGVRRIIEKVQNVMHDILDLQDSSFSPLKISYIGMSLLDTVTSLYNGDEDMFDNWDDLFDSNVLDAVLARVINKLPKVEVVQGNTIYITYTLPSGIQIGLSKSASTYMQIVNMNNDVQTLNYKVSYETAGAAREEVCGLIWESFGDSSLSISKSDNKLSIEVIEDEPLITKITTDVIKNIQVYQDNGHNRSLLFYGPPGTGKTTTAYSICKKLNLRTVIVPSIIAEERGSNDDMSFIMSLIRIGKPDAIIFDDFEKLSYNHDKLLAYMQDLKKKTKLVVVTVNDLARLPTALIRPGRIDEIIEINFIDPEILKIKLGEDDKELIETMSSWH